MMRLALFEILERPCAIALDKVLHVQTDPHVFRLPLLRSCFAGIFVCQGLIVPLLACKRPEAGNNRAGLQPGFVLVCEAEFGLIGIPADRIVRITKAGELDSEVFPESASQSQDFEINGRNFRLLDLAQIFECPDFTICMLKD